MSPGPFDEGVAGGAFQQVLDPAGEGLALAAREDGGAVGVFRQAGRVGAPGGDQPGRAAEDGHGSAGGQELALGPGVLLRLAGGCIDVIHGSIHRARQCTDGRSCGSAPQWRS